MKKLKLFLSIFFLSTMYVFAQDKATGRVTLSDGTPVTGASVIVKKTNAAAVTDANGYFSVTAAKNATLVISNVGFANIEILNDGSQSSIILKESSRTMSDVVVVGYGSQRRKNITGAISRITNEAITAVPVADVRQALQGRVPGVVVTANGSPGEAPIIRIRGIGSINYSSEPFYVVMVFRVQT